VENERSGETVRQYYSEISKVKEYVPTLRLFQITPDWLKGYSKYCYFLGNKTTSIFVTGKSTSILLPEK